jgi:hypothetical protein
MPSFFAAFHHQAGHLAQRIRFGDPGVGRPHVFGHELVVEFLLRHDDAHLAHVRAGHGSDQFHGHSLDLFWFWTIFILGEGHPAGGAAAQHPHPTIRE